MNTSHMTAGKRTVMEIVFVSCIVLFAGIIRIPALTQPLGPDQGIMAVIGEGILHGKLPYRDYWEMASPAIFFTYALMFKIFGSTMAAIPITDTLVSMLTTLLVFMLAKSIWDRRVGYLSALFYAFFSSGLRLGMHANGDICFGTFWYLAQRETFMLPLLTGSFYFILGSGKENRKRWRLILSGFLAGLAFAYKFPALLFFICLLIYSNGNVLLKEGTKPFKKLVINNAALILGFFIPLIPFVLFFWAKGALGDMIDIIFKYVFSVYGQLEHNNRWILKLGLDHTIFVAGENFILWIFFITSSIYIIANERRNENLLIVLWGLASVLYIISHKEFFGYHYLVILPPFSVLTGYGVVKAWGTRFTLGNDFHGRTARAAVILTIFFNLIVFAAIIHKHYTKFYFYYTGKISKDTYYDFFTAYPKHDYSFSADYKVARYIVNHTDADDMIYTIGGIESVLHFLTKRRSPSRFIYSWILFSYDHSKVKEAVAYREELFADLKAQPPKYIVSVRPIETYKQYAPIYNFVKNNYILEKRFPDDRFVYAYEKN